jgi:FixJ family two-component response regulator
MHSLLTDIFRKRKTVIPAIVALLEEPDCAAVRELSVLSKWDVSFAATFADAQALIGQADAHILFLDRDLAGTNWREAMSAFASSSRRICIVLVSRVSDASLWSEVIRHGGYEVLSKPLRQSDVLRVVSLAWSYWSSSAGWVKK